MPDPSFSARSIHFVSQFVVIVQSALQEWSSATAFQKAFEIGDGEAQAVVNLLTKVPPPIVSELKSAVRTRGMRNWISHQMIAKEIFNVGFSSACNSPFDRWGERLVNGADNGLESCATIWSIFWFLPLKL